MTARFIPLRAEAALVAAGALTASLLVGILLAEKLPLGVGLLIGACYAPLVLIDLPLALALWVALVFIEHLPATSIGPNAAGLMVAFAWLGTLRSHGVARQVLRRHAGLLTGLALLVVWVTLSLSWARDPAAAGLELWPFYVAALLVVIVLTTASGARNVRLLLAAFVAGAALTVLIGLVAQFVAGGAADSATQTEGRLQGGAGDPNFLAAVLVPAMVLAVGLGASARSAHRRLLLGVAIVVLAAGLAATASRGAFVAAAVTAVAAIVLLRGRRVQVALLVVAGLSIAGAAFAVSPAAWERATSFDTKGNGRSDLWQVALRMSHDHPVAGVGLNNFRERSSAYVRRPGELQFVDLIAERPHVVHNTYLQLLAETGAVGLALFLLVCAGCLRAGWSACRRFDAAGEFALAAIARSVVLAAIGMLAAALFLSAASDKRLWLLLALGPALLSIAGPRPQPDAARA